MLGASRMAVGKQVDGRRADQRHERPDRKIDAADEDRQRHAEGEDRVDRDLLGQVEQVVEAPESLDGAQQAGHADAEQDLQDDDCHQERAGFA